MKRAVMILALMLAASCAYGAEEMGKLDFLIGEWKGEAWMQRGPGKPEYYLQTEKVTPKAGGKALLVEGLGRKKLEDGSAGEVIHDAIALISWDKTKKNYRFDAHVAQQESVDTAIEVTAPNTAMWGFDTPQGKIRFTIRLTDKGEWNEIGEFSRDGANWMKFFEMTLTKSK
ncbi:MAG: hypothetical protein M3P06_14440 [Acidobacteriota bacterium]|nr:hypothetical protein [Acidobacteriota bacterium]